MKNELRLTPLVDVTRQAGGEDALYGGAGTDWLFGQGGDDYLEGGKRLPSNDENYRRIA